jgi:hypothetical protein
MVGNLTQITRKTFLASASALPGLVRTPPKKIAIISTIFRLRCTSIKNRPGTRARRRQRNPASRSTPRSQRRFAAVDPSWPLTRY